MNKLTIARSSVLIVAALVLGGLLTYAHGGLSLAHPAPFWVLYLYDLSLSLGIDVVLLAAILIAVLFLVWNPQLFRGESRIPKRSLLLLVVFAVSSTGFLGSRFSLMAEIDHLNYFFAICTINALILAVLIALAGVKKDRQPLWRSVAFHWLLFAWPASYGFPWLYEAL